MALFTTSAQLGVSSVRWSSDDGREDAYDQAMEGTNSASHCVSWGNQPLIWRGYWFKAPPPSRPTNPPKPNLNIVINVSAAFSLGSFRLYRANPASPQRQVITVTIPNTSVKELCVGFDWGYAASFAFTAKGQPRKRTTAGSRNTTKN